MVRGPLAITLRIGVDVAFSLPRSCPGVSVCSLCACGEDRLTVLFKYRADAVLD